MWAATPRAPDAIKSEAPRNLEDAYSDYSKAKRFCTTDCRDELDIRYAPSGIASKDASDPSSACFARERG